MSIEEELEMSDVMDYEKMENKSSPYECFPNGTLLYPFAIPGEEGNVTIVNVTNATQVGGAFTSRPRRPRGASALAFDIATIILEPFGFFQTHLEPLSLLTKINSKIGCYYDLNGHTYYVGRRAARMDLPCHPR